MSQVAESARGIAPRAPHRSGLDTLASSGSCHRMKSVRLLPLPVDPTPTAMTCPLRSAGITPLQHLYEAPRVKRLFVINIFLLSFRFKRLTRARFCIDGHGSPLAWPR